MVSFVALTASEVFGVITFDQSSSRLATELADVPFKEEAGGEHYKVRRPLGERRRVKNWGPFKKVN